MRQGEPPRCVNQQRWARGDMLARSILIGRASTREKVVTLEDATQGQGKGRAMQRQASAGSATFSALSRL